MDERTREAYEEEKRRIRRRAMIERARKEKLKRQKIRRILIITIPVVVLALIVLLLTILMPKKKKEKEIIPETVPKNVSESVPESVTEAVTGADFATFQINTVGVNNTMTEISAILGEEYIKLPPMEAKQTDKTQALPDSVVSLNGILVDIDTEEIIAMKDPYTAISPASMTKILTILVAAEHVENLEDTFVIDRSITDYSFVNDCSNVGFLVGEEVTVKDLFYGTILPSGADAALGLAIYTAGSHEAFVDMMNERLAELGLSETAHFTNCVGLYDKEHFCSVYDMAVILKAAYDNPLCREVLSAHTYTTTPTTEHPEGMILSNWFLRRIEDKDTYGEVLCAKTGYVVQSKSCAASLGMDKDGKRYICVTAGSTSSWRCIEDHVDIYAKYMKVE